MENKINEEFDGVFKFSNPTDTDFVALWNNKEYIFHANTTSPMVISNESPENVQEIRKKFAYKLATREFYAGKVYNTMKKQGNGMPPTFDEKVLEPMIEQCLKPLPSGRVTVKTRKAELGENVFKGSKALSDSDNVNEVFKDAPVQKLGRMSDK